MPLLDNTTINGTPLQGLNPESGEKVRVSCNRCGAEYEVGYKSYICRQREYSRNGETYCRSCSNIVSKGKCKRGPAKNARSVGNRNANFRGGRYVHSDGNVMVLVAPGQYQREDFLVLQKELGRAVDPKAGERVLHIDLDKTNNARGNLVLLPTAAYLSAKKSLEQVALDLLKRGLVTYDTSSNAYIQSGGLSTLKRPSPINVALDALKHLGGKQ